MLDIVSAPNCLRGDLKILRVYSLGGCMQPLISGGGSNFFRKGLRKFNMHIRHAAFYKSCNPIRNFLWCITKWDPINDTRLTLISLNNVLIMSLMTLILFLLCESLLSEPKLWLVLELSKLIYCVKFISIDGHHLVWCHSSWLLLKILKLRKGPQKISNGSFAIILIKIKL